MMKLALSLLLITFSSLQVFADPAQGNACEVALHGKHARLSKGFVAQRDGLPIYYEFYRIKNPKNVVVVSNGLVYELSHYKDFAKKMNEAGYSVLIYAHRAQHQSEEKARESGLDFKQFNYENLSDDLEDLLQGLRITKPIDLVSISFGTAVAAEFALKTPERVRTLNLLAPLVRLATPYVMTRSFLASVRAFNPLLAPIVPDPNTPYELMISSVEKFDLEKYSFHVPTALYLAGLEAKNLRPQQDQYWERRLSRENGRLFELQEANHVMPTSAPEELAKALVEFIESIPSVK